MKGIMPAAATVATLALSPASAGANERHYAYAYESATLPAGARELELWTTARYGQRQRYARFDNRFELEWGLTDTLLTAFYLNTKALVEGSGDQAKEELSFAGISSEWKLKLSDPVADALGSGLYAEASFGPDELGLEAKLLLDKRLGAVLLAANLVFELEVEQLGDENETARVFEIDLAGSYFITPRVSVGIEARGHGEHKLELEPVALFAGPVAAWSWGRSWAAMTLLTQIGAVGEAVGGFHRDLRAHQAVDARLLLGSDF